MLFSKKKLGEEAKRSTIKVASMAGKWWQPNNGDTYYWVRSDIGMICESEWADGVRKHEFRKSIGNVFRSRTDAEAAIVMQQGWQAERINADENI